MKKIIVHNDEYIYHAKYIISKKNLAIVIKDKVKKLRNLQFLIGKNNSFIGHRPCNLGPQSRLGPRCINEYNIKYREKGKYHNLYGPALIYKDNTYYSKRYFINNIEYNLTCFFKYVVIYNTLSYKRTY